MGLFATLINTPLDCPKCGLTHKHTWQFYFGAVNNLTDYKIGDSIHWDTYYCYGFASMEEVYAVAYPKPKYFARGVPILF